MPFSLRQMRWQIAVTYTLLIIFSLAGLASVLYVLNRSTYLRTLESGIVGQAYLIADLVEAAPPAADNAHFDVLVDALGRQLAARVTLIDPSGQMLADSLLPPERYTSRSDRPEVVAALQSGLGETQRHSTTTGDDRFYVAVPFERGGSLAGVVRVGVPLNTIAATQAQIALAVLAAALLAAMVSFALAVLIARRTTRPLLELRGMAEQLAAGDLAVQVPVPAAEEVGALARSFNQMASRLRQLVDTQARERERLTAILASMQDGILIVDAHNQVTLANRAASEVLALTRQAPFSIIDMSAGPAILNAAHTTRNLGSESATTLIDEITPPTGRSLRAIITRLGDPAEPQTLVMLQDLTELRRADRSRRMLMTNITHDLRTPLASLQALIDTLVDGAIDDAEAARDFLGRMDIEVQGLSHLVNEFLLLSRIELGQVTICRTATDLPELLHTVAERMMAQARQKGVSIAVEAAATIPSIEIDSGRIEQVLLNLLQNALTYTLDGGRITVGALMRGADVMIRVEDTGIGIDSDALPHIFERFYKADASRSDPGIGLGLAIAKHLVESHNGHIWAESAVGKGTTITFALPSVLAH